MSRLRAEDGTTLMEVLIAVTVGFVVLAATLGLLDSTLRLSGGVMAKTDAMQRGRLAMDRVTQQLRSQVCLDLTTAAVVPGATSNSITFYADFADGGVARAPDKRTLAFNPSTGNITETVWKGKIAPDGKFTYNDPPLQNLVLENAALEGGKAFMRFYAYEETGNPPRLDSTLQLTTPLDAAAAARVARIDVAFASRPTGAKTGKDAVNIEDRVSVRHADPNLSVPDPLCV